MLKMFGETGTQTFRARTLQQKAFVLYASDEDPDTKGLDWLWYIAEEF